MQQSKVKNKSIKKINLCRYYIWTHCKNENCKFKHDEKMRKEYLSNPPCSNYKKNGSCTICRGKIIRKIKK